MTKRLLIAGMASGVGKTTISVGLIAALRRRGLVVQPFKVGPDYIDPRYHALAAGRPCPNLDAWLMPRERLLNLFHQKARGADLAVIEGVMGVFDGLGYEEETGSTAQVAKWLEAPVVLVLDAGKMARSAAALALGYQQFDPDLPLAGFIVNRIGSPQHGQGVSQAIEKATSLPVFGALPRQPRLQAPERRLGLLSRIEADQWNEFGTTAADMVSASLDLDRLWDAAGAGGPHEFEGVEMWSGKRGVPSPRPVIAVAQDEAFHFTYQENLDLLQAAGAEVVFFSPLRDQALPESTAGIILSGGFPESYAEALAANVAMHEALRTAHRHGLPIYAECGGLMYLTREIVDAEQRVHVSVGLLPGRSIMMGKLTLGYRLAEAAADSWLLHAGETVRGHEFHYSIWQDRPDDLPPAYFARPAHGNGPARPEGARSGNLIASYLHLHFWSKPELAERFVTACRRAAKMEPLMAART
jgi:cobyrinic acid a,c-diamide synthase